MPGKAPSTPKSGAGKAAVAVGGGAVVAAAAGSGALGEGAQQTVQNTAPAAASTAGSGLGVPLWALVALLGVVVVLAVLVVE